MEENNIAVVGLGYVGLPLAVEFGKKIHTIGFDINESRIADLKNSKDNTLEVSTDELQQEFLNYTSNLENIRNCNIYIIAVPTPIDSYKQPDLTIIKNVSKMIGSVLKQGDLVIYESTVYPGATEEDCVPILEHNSGLKFNEGFFCGYSPERINPGDKVHRLPDIQKVTSGSTPEIATRVDNLYKKIITAGTHKASSIRVAEAAKVIENTQRDVNIALVNELSIIFNKLNIDTEEVLIAAGTKWNFLPFRPGLVGGHCIGVDPYYLTHKATLLGYTPEIILAGRRLNDNMGNYIATEVSKIMTKKRIHVVDANILIMGFSFKEDCPDIRNTRVIDVVKEFENFNCKVDVYDPCVSKKEANDEYKISLIDKPTNGKYNAIIIAVAHSEFKKMNINEIKELGSSNNYIIYDVKSIFDAKDSDGRL
jgi:UDP-N-acetyl-D-galactosamine dehydrogenase